ncbi:uncharacterized protein LOC133883733 isoform X2 [Phragmites australis]|uniref:uncharacterized protein LOC133883733 isoform X2 n=1 Tax=Phragmites australis TaxID=29695 RepID=UPI002D77DDCF|nr:uncharacterized protein LOC133883733 isoform X2 [Phragmites australis]
MRLSSPNLDAHTQQEIAEFSTWVLNLGEGKLQATAQEGELEPTWIKIPHELLLMTDNDKISCLVNAICPDLQNKFSDIEYLGTRAILTPTNELADQINSYIVSLIPGNHKEYLSCDRISKAQNNHDSYDLLYPIEFLNSLNGNNFPQHKLILKKGLPIMLVLNLNQSSGLCNGTRLIITVMGDMIIESQIITDTHAGHNVFIPRICLILKNNKLPFMLERRQFPIKVCYGMTINKSQGQTLDKVYKMPFHLLPTLHPKAKHWTICARVSRKWEYRGGTDDGPITHIDLVLVDEKGNAMYGEIPSSEIEAKDPLIQEGGIYVVSRFRVSNARSLYRLVNAPYMIEFTCYTKITPARDPPEAFPRYVYRLTPFTDLSQHASENKYFLDVIGIITGVSDIALVQLPNQANPTLSKYVILKDLNNEQPTPIVILVVGSLMKAFRGQEYLSGNTACHWYFNPAIPEAEPFYRITQKQHLIIKHTTVSTQEGTHLQKPIELEDKQLKDLEAMNPYDFPEGGYRCTVTITRLSPNTAWWFPSCNRCSRACVPDGIGYKCNACSCTGYRFKYKLCFITSDGTAEAEMVAFGEAPPSALSHDEAASKKPTYSTADSSKQPTTCKRLFEETTDSTKDSLPPHRTFKQKDA